jgi:hypothetical protein
MNQGGRNVVQAPSKCAHHLVTAKGKAIRQSGACGLAKDAMYSLAWGVA